MKKMILSLMSATFICTAFAANCVSVKQIGTNYASHQITIAITRTGCTGDATNHRNTVWVFVDYRTATGATKGAWTRATISATSAGTVVNSGNSKGAWIYGTNGTQTVTLTLSGMPAKYDWCAFATDYPPNVATFNNGTYTLRGTAPFLLNGNTTVHSTTYAGAAISSITDATGCPGIACGNRDANVGAGGCCLSGLTLIGSYCRDLTADAAYNYCGIEIKKVDAYSSTAFVFTAVDTHCPSGWRWPTPAEAVCMYQNRTVTGLTTARWGYATRAGTGATYCAGSNFGIMKMTTAIGWCSYTGGKVYTFRFNQSVPMSPAGAVRCVRL